MQGSKPLIDMLLDGNPDPMALKAALERIEAEKEMVMARIEAGEYEVVPDED